MMLLALAAALAAAGGTQAPARPLETASVGGVVSAADTGAPLPRVRVLLASDAIPAPRIALTDPAGRFQIERLPAGLYRLNFTLTGYVSQAFPVPIELAERQRVDRANVALQPAGVIAGRILDEDGAPLGGARVEALHRASEGGQGSLTPAAQDVTDDLGEFRLSGLAPGQYIVAATDPAFEAVGDGRGALTYMPTYYPGVSTPERAVGVTAAVRSSPPSRIELRLRLVRPVDVSGRLLTFNDRPLRSAAVVMSPQTEDGNVNRSVGDARISPDGTFQFANVPPGRYALRARGETERDGVALFATYSLAVESQEVPAVSLTLVPGGLIEGRVSVTSRHGHAPPALTALRIRAPLSDGSAFGDSLTGAVTGNGAFRLTGLMPGAHVLVVDGLTFPWRVADARVHGRDVTERPVDVEPGQEFRDAQIVLTDTAAGVSGVVRMPRHAGADEALVIAMPADALRRRVPLLFVRVARPIAGGAFRVDGLVPGEYLIVASLHVTEQDVTDARVLDRLAPLGTRVVLQEARITELSLEVQDTDPRSLP